MAVSRTQTQVAWSTNATISLTTGAPAVDSDAVTFGASTFDATVSVKADNAGTPASGDTVDVYALYTNGDPDAAPDSADEFDTSAHAEYLGTLDTDTEDPAIKTFRLKAAAKGVKVRCESNAASNSITASAQITELQA